MEEFRVCPNCRYPKGFHVSIRREAEGVRIVLICPSCGQSYDPGWQVTINDAAPAAGETY